MVFLHQLLLIAGITCASFAFGVSLALGDLLQKRGYRWFPRAELVTGVVAAGLGVGMLALAHPPLQILWLAAVVSWLLRGRVDGPSHGLAAAALLAAIVFGGPRVEHYPWVAVYFFSILIPLGAAHDLLRATSLRTSRWVAWSSDNQHLYWYAMAAGYCLWFELDPVLCLCVYGFAQGQRHLRDEGRLARLRSWGLRKSSNAPSA